MDGLSPFERLPCELVCMIIDYTPESFFQLGETSKMLRSHTHAYALKPATCNLVKQITFEFADANMVVMMRKHTTGLFLLRLKLRSPNYGDDEFFRGMRSGNTICRLPFDLILRDNFFQLLTECMGRKIDTVRIYQLSNQDATVFKILDFIQFDKLKVASKKLTNEHFDNIVNICETQSIEELFLYCTQNECANPVNTLVKLASLVRTIVIEQGHNENVVIHQYFFGLTNADWAPIILDMFSRKMDKLSMTNAFGVVGALSANSADILRARLPWTGKKLWFDAVGDPNAESNYTLENDHIIRGPTANRRGFSLTVKHLSRKEETVEEFIL